MAERPRVSGAEVAGLRCVRCGRHYGRDEVSYTCPSCGVEGVLDVRYDYERISADLRREDLAESSEISQWRYLPLIPVGPASTIPSLRTGWTPLYPARGLLGLARLYVKDESGNPTGSLKDRATSVAIARAKGEGATTVAAASTGNAGCSLAGYAAAEGMSCYIFVPRDAPRAKVAQLLIYGATVFAVDGSYDDAFDLAIQAIETFGWYNRCCAVNPYLVEGKKTAAFEICEQLGWRAPDTVFVPVGDGCIVSGLYKGFSEFAGLGFVERLPKLIGVQAEGCQPVKLAFDTGEDVSRCQSRTRADSIGVGCPRNWRKAVEGIRSSGGVMISVSDEEILEAMAELAAATGVFGEPAGVAAFAGLARAVKDGQVGADETIVVMMTGSGLKDTESATAAAGRPIAVGKSLQDIERALGGAARTHG